MTEIRTAAQMRAVEQAAIDSGAVSGARLMARAGQGVVDAVLAQWPDLDRQGTRALILCGPGNNGGDGFVIARLMCGLGWDIDVFLSGAPDKMPADAKAAHETWARLGQVQAMTAEAIRGAPQPDIIIDALFGIGLARALPVGVTEVFGVLGEKRGAGKPVIRHVAVDAPSGLNLDTGRMLLAGDVTPLSAGAQRADLTVTFHRAKPGHYLAQGPEYCGRLCVVDIGLNDHDQTTAALGAAPDPNHIRLIEPCTAGSEPPAKVWPNAHIPKAQHNAHKFEHGHVMVFAGGVGRGGAGRLAARAALRVGAGVVTLACPPAAVQENACRLDAIMLRALRKDAPLGDVADDRVSAFCIGPGLGVTERTRDLVAQVLARQASARHGRAPAVVLDADALGSFANDPDSLFTQCHARCILTPHEGEFARLFPDLSLQNRGALSKIDVVRKAAARAGCVVLLKGSDTVIATPQGGASLHAAAYDRQVPWLATAGAGDVLAGVIAGLAAPAGSGDLITMAEIAVYLHVQAALNFGPGLTADDLPDELPKVFRQLGL